MTRLADAVAALPSIPFALVVIGSAYGVMIGAALAIVAVLRVLA